MNKTKKIILGGILLGLALMCTMSVYATTIFTQKTGSLDIIEPIEINVLETPNMATRSIYPGENITFKYKIKNIADKDYWIAGRIWPSSEDNQYIWTKTYGEMRTEAQGKTSYRTGEAVLIRAKTTNILTLTLEIREDSPPATGIIVYSQIVRTEAPSKGID